MLFQRSFSKPIALTISLCSSLSGSLPNSLYQIKHKLLVFISKAFTDNTALSFITHLVPRNRFPPPAGCATSLPLPLLGSQTITLTLSSTLPLLHGVFFLLSKPRSAVLSSRCLRTCPTRSGHPPPPPVYFFQYNSAPRS